MPLSLAQYEKTGLPRLVGRLTYRNCHLLALRISAFAYLDPGPVLKHWARAKIMRSAKGRGIAADSNADQATDDQLCNLIVEKLRDHPTVSFAEIARDAWAAGRVRLGTKLLVHEPRAVDQVPLLLSMHEDQVAIEKAVESGDTDLILHVLLRLKHRLSRADFFRIMQRTQSESESTDPARPRDARHLNIASDLLEEYARNEDRELLSELYFQDDRRLDMALLALESASETGQWAHGASDRSVTDDQMSSLVTLLQDAANSFKDDKARVLESKLVGEEIRLLAFQSALQKEISANHRIVGNSLNDTIRFCLTNSLPKKADKLRSDFKVPDRRFWAIKIDALVRSEEWSALQSFASSKKSPIGYAPFIQKLIEANNTKDLEFYLEKMSDKGDRQKLERYLRRLPYSSNKLTDAILVRLNEMY